MLPVENVKTFCICGAGTMGSGITQVVAQAGFKVIQFDVQRNMLDKSRKNIEDAFQKLVDKGKLSPEQIEKSIDNIVFTTEIAECRADVIIEAIIENKSEKIALFNKLSATNNATTIFATNTSSISINKIAEATAVPTRIAGMHFFNPAPVMRLVEIVRASQTSESVIDLLVALAIKMNKVPVVCKDVPGFIVNRVARQYYLEALHLVENGDASIETIDAIMESAGFKMGPFKLMDLIGMDINYEVSRIVWESLGSPQRLMPSALQKEKVQRGELGRKTGKGFYQY